MGHFQIEIASLANCWLPLRWEIDLIQLHNPVASLNTKTWNLNHNRLDYVFQFNTPSKSICVNQEHHSNTRINQLLTNFPFSIGLTFILPSTLITQTQMLAWVFCIHCFTKFKCKHKFWVVVLGVRERKRESLVILLFWNSCKLILTT